MQLRDLDWLGDNAEKLQQPEFKSEEWWLLMKGLYDYASAKKHDRTPQLDIKSTDRIKTLKKLRENFTKSLPPNWTAQISQLSQTSDNAEILYILFLGDQFMSANWAFNGGEIMDSLNFAYQLEFTQRRIRNRGHCSP
jgi:hypothetical protein